MGSIQKMLEHLISALRERIGQEITPEVAARLTAAAAFEPGPDSPLGPYLILARSRKWADDLVSKTGHFFNGARTDLIAWLDDDNEPRAYAAFTNIVPGVRADLGVWSRGDHGGGARGFLSAVGFHAFQTLGAQTLTAFIAESNAASLSCAEHMGFRELGRIPHYFGQEPAVFMTTTPDAYRW